MVRNARNATVAVGTGAVVVLPETFPRRTRYVLKNTSSGTQIITVSFGQEKLAVANEGIPLSVGAVISDSDSESYQCFSGAITAIADGASAQLSVFEA